jgi:hypothetical protein
VADFFESGKICGVLIVASFWQSQGSIVENLTDLVNLARLLLIDYRFLTFRQGQRRPRGPSLQQYASTIIS